MVWFYAEFTYGVLSFHTEEESGGEAVDLSDTPGPRLICWNWFIFHYPNFLVFLPPIRVEAEVPGAGKHLLVQSDVH